MVSHRRALERLWTDACTVYIRETRVNPITKRTEYEEMILHANLKCKLSFERLETTAEDGMTARVTQAAKLILAPEHAIPPGCRISVARNGAATEYAQSGEAGVYTNHQEIPLALFKGWA